MSIAQEPDYDSMVVRVQNTNAYFRFDHIPIALCPIEGYTAAWQEATEAAVRDIGAAVPMVIQQNPCDISLSFVARIPRQCGGAHVWGCTQIDYEADGDYLRMISTVYILRHRPGKQWLVSHELLHALGITGHSRNKRDITYTYVTDSVSALSDYDIDVLTYLYSQPAFTGHD